MKPSITFTSERKFTQAQVEELFRSIHWVSGNYPQQLYQALLHSSFVLTAWDVERLVGLVRGLDDGGMIAFLHCCPYFYINVMPDGVVMQICNKDF